MLKKSLTILALIALLLVVILLSTPTMVWDGSFREAEYQLRFVDEQGSPIEGVELRVEDERGANYFHYPVTDYLDGKIPTSDTRGAMTFHHVSYSIEFGGRCKELFGVLRLGECHGPKFVCRFIRGGREVYQYPFNRLNAAAVVSEERATRKWTWDEFLPIEYPKNPGPDWFQDQRTASDRNGNGTHDIVERAAFQATACAIDKHEDIQRGSIAPVADLEFRVYRMKIVVRDKLAVKYTRR